MASISEATVVEATPTSHSSVTSRIAQKAWYGTRRNRSFCLQGDERSDCWMASWMMSMSMFRNDMVTCQAQGLLRLPSPPSARGRPLFFVPDTSKKGSLFRDAVCLPLFQIQRHTQGVEQQSRPGLGYLVDDAVAIRQCFPIHPPMALPPRTSS